MIGRSATAIFALTLLAGAAGPAVAAEDPIAAHRWKSRLLVVVAPGENDPALAAQRKLFRAAGAENRDRDLLLVEGIGAGPKAEALRRRFEVPAGEFRAILVGKDGGEKLTSREPIPAERLFSEIDAMPMRRDEVRGNR